MPPETTVLIVEDDPDLAETYAAWLADDHDVRTATDGEAALSLLDADVDVVLLDRRMPGMSGDRVLRRLRDRGLDCRVAMITGVEPDFDVVEMGFDDYLRKPVFRDDVRGTVARLRRRQTYDVQSRRYFALLSKRAVLEGYKSPEELDDAEAYAEMERRIDAVRTDIDRTVDEMDAADFDALFRDFEADRD